MRRGIGQRVLMILVSMILRASPAIQASEFRNFEPDLKRLTSELWRPTEVEMEPRGVVPLATDSQLEDIQNLDPREVRLAQAWHALLASNAFSAYNTPLTYSTGVKPPRKILRIKAVINTRPVFLPASSFDLSPLDRLRSLIRLKYR